jgi:thiamine pyrophosphate-dependent acetolactate synthase large subunit-like protein
MTGAKALLEQLRADGVTHVFGNPGSTEIGFVFGLVEQPEIEFVLALHEGVAVGAADAYARFTRRPAFVQLHVAPGLGNGLGMLYNAHQAHSPLVVYAGNASTKLAAKQPILGDDLVRMAAPFCKWAYEILQPADIPLVLRRAMKVAMEPPAGPVFLSIPMDVLDGEGESSVSSTVYTRTGSRPAVADVDAAATLALASSSPFVVVGDGTANGAVRDEIVALADLIGAPVMGGGWSSEPVVPTSYELWADAFEAWPTPYALEAFAKADLIFYLGSPTIPEPCPTSLSRGDTRVVQVDLNTWELAKNFPVELSIAADPSVFAFELAERIRERQSPGYAEAARERRERQVKALAAAKAQARERDAQDRDSKPITGARLAQDLAEVIPSDAVVFDDSISMRLATRRYLEGKPGAYFRARGPGIGAGMAGTVGVGLAAADRPVVGLVADGSAMYTCTAMWTAAHHRVPVTWIICNNRSYRTLKVNGRTHLGDRTGVLDIPQTDLGDPPISFVQLAESMGVSAHRVEDPNDLAEAMHAAIEEQTPTLVEVVIEGVS